MRLNFVSVCWVCIASGILLSGCKDIGSDVIPISRFSSNKTVVNIVKGSSAQLTLSGGTIPYKITTSPDSTKATCSLTSSLVTVLAVDTGTTFFVLKDNSTPVPDSLEIQIVISATPPPPSVHFATQIQPIFNSQCTSCHGTQGGLSLQSGVSYGNLVNVQAQSACTNLKRVSPNDAANSVLYRKVSGTSCGSQMPQGGALNAQDITRIQTWINEGANNN